LREKWEEVEKNLLLLLPLTTKPRTFSFSFHWPPSQEPSPSPSIGHQAKNLLLLLLLPLATKPKTFSLFLKDELGSWEGVLPFSLEKQFQFNLESVCFYKFLEEGE
jgi:hypothetical protein